MAYTKHLEVALDSDSGRAVIWPNNPKLGRYVVRGLVVAGIKSMLYRRVDIYLTHREAEELRDDLSRWLKEYPDTGTETEVHTGGSHSARH